MTASKITTSNLADQAEFMLNAGRIHPDLVKKMIAELRRLEEEMSELFNDLEALQLDKEAVECERDTSYERNAQLQARIAELEEQLKNALNNN